MLTFMPRFGGRRSAAVEDILELLRDFAAFWDVLRDLAGAVCIDVVAEVSLTTWPRQYTGDDVWYDIAV